MDILRHLEQLDMLVSSIDQFLLIKLWCLFSAIAAVKHKDDNNILLLICVILVPKLLDTFYLSDFLYNSPSVSNVMFYVWLAVCDFGIVLLILCRARVFEATASFYLFLLSILFPGIHREKGITLMYQRHIDEFKIISVYAACIFINLFMVLEYGIRKLGYKDVLYVYHLYTPLKFALNTYMVWLLFKVGFKSPSVFLKEK